MEGVLGHQGGWDEVAFIFVPVCVFAGLLWLANRRASEMEARRDAELGGVLQGPSDVPSQAPEAD